MGDTTRRFIAMHETEAGFDSPAAVQDWLGAVHGEDYAKWRVVEILVDPVTERLANGQVARAREEGYIAGIEMERKLMRLRLGLAVKGDSGG